MIKQEKTKKILAREIQFVVVAIIAIGFIFLAFYLRGLYKEYNISVYGQRQNDIATAIDSLPSDKLYRYYKKCEENMYNWYETPNDTFLVHTASFKKFLNEYPNAKSVIPRIPLVRCSEVPSRYRIYSLLEMIPEISSVASSTLSDKKTPTKETIEKEQIKRTILEAFDEEYSCFYISHIPYNQFVKNIQDRGYADLIYNEFGYSSYGEFVDDVYDCRLHSTGTISHRDSLWKETASIQLKKEGIISDINKSGSDRASFIWFALIVAFPVRYLWLLFKWSRQQVNDM